MSLLSLTLPTVSALKYHVMSRYELDTIFKTNLLGFPTFREPKNLAIDTSPDSLRENEHTSKAKRARNEAVFTTGLYGSAAIGLVGYAVGKTGISSLENACFLLGMTGQFFAPSVELWLGNIKRFNKVVRGEYAIVEPPQKDRDAPNLSFNPT